MNDENIIAKSVSACLLDIEGTTTSISFVKDELFPYVSRNLSKYLHEHWKEEECQTDIVNLLAQAPADRTASDIVLPVLSDYKDKHIPIDIKDTLIEYIEWLMERDSKTTPLKTLQGHMWREAYISGDIKGHLYNDVADSMKHWYKQRIKLYTYSSGSVEAQKLLFGHSVAGDILKYLSGHFDTNIGNKRDTDSYSTIVKEIGCEASSVLFLTDVIQEARAADAVGLQVILVCHPGNTPVSEEDLKQFDTLETFESLTLSLDKATDDATSTKKRNESAKAEQAP